MSPDYFKYWNLIGAVFAFLGVIQVILLGMILKKIGK